MASDDNLVLLADIGGTKTDVAVTQSEESIVQAVDVRTFLNAEYRRPEDVLDAFFKKSNGKVRNACIAVAGPVNNGSTRLTNLPWTLDTAHLADRYGLEHVYLINDLHALGCAVPHLGPNDSCPLVAGKPSLKDALLVISPGTGLGMALVIPDGCGHRVLPSEGGNAAFGASTPEQRAIAEFICEKTGHARTEDLCSGPAIQHIYRYMIGTNPARMSPKDKEIGQLPSENLTPAIVGSALSEDGSELCYEAVRAFIEILADVIRNYALTFMARGGVFIAGSLPLTLKPLLQQFLGSEFSWQVKSNALALNMPVHLVEIPHPVLTGAHFHLNATINELG